MPKHIKQYLTISYIFSWTLWFLAWLIASSRSTSILVNHDILMWPGRDIIQLAVSISSSVATLGPLLGYLVIRKKMPASRLSWNGFRSSLYVFAGFAVSSAIIGFIFSSINTTINYTVLILALPYYMVTSATEEFGWRGVVQDWLQTKSKSLWDMSLKMSLIWGPWHYPIVVYMFVQQGLSGLAIVSSLIGFTFSIALMSQLHGWLRLRYRGIWPNVLLHGLHNWWPVVLGLLLAEEVALTYAILGGYLLVSILLDVRWNSDDLVKFSQIDKTDS